LIVLSLSVPELQATGAIPLVASKAVMIAVQIALVAVAAGICIIRPKIIEAGPPGIAILVDTTPPIPVALPSRVIFIRTARTVITVIRAARAVITIISAARAHMGIIIAAAPLIGAVLASASVTLAMAFAGRLVTRLTICGPVPELRITYGRAGRSRTRQLGATALLSERIWRRLRCGLGRCYVVIARRLVPGAEIMRNRFVVKRHGCLGGIGWPIAAGIWHYIGQPHRSLLRLRGW
jgi:hypothetical protein